MNESEQLRRGMSYEDNEGYLDYSGLIQSPSTADHQASSQRFSNLSTQYIDQSLWYAQPQILTFSHLPTENQAQLAVYGMKKQVEVEATVAKEAYLNDVRYNLLRRKKELEEEYKEKKKANYLEVSIDGNGMVMAKVKNSFIHVPERRVVNFRVCGIFDLVSSEGEGGFICLRICKEDEHVVDIFLDCVKAGRVTYFGKKLTEMGCLIYANTKKNREEILTALWAVICCKKQGTLVIPVCEGWMSVGEQRYRFVKKGERLWREIQSQAK